MARIAVLFDVDGVLNCMHSGKELDDANIFHFKQICSLGEITLVLASTWKDLFCDDMPEEGKRMGTLLVNKLKEYGLHIDSMTPDLHGGRPEECAKWLQDHKGEYDSYLILDDDFSLEEYGKYGIGNGLIQTKFFCTSNKDGGLQEKHVGIAGQVIAKQWISKNNKEAR